MAINWDKAWKDNVGSMNPPERKIKSGIDWEAAKQQARALDMKNYQKQTKKKLEEEKKQQQEQQKQQQQKLRKLQTSPLSVRAKETLAGLQEGSQMPKAPALHPTAPLKLSKQEMLALGMGNENGFLKGGVSAAEIGLDQSELDALQKSFPAAQLPGYKVQTRAIPSAGTNAEKSGRKDYAGYLAGQFGAGIFSNPAGILSGAQTAMGDLATGGRVSNEMQTLNAYFGADGDMLQRFMSKEFGVNEQIKKQTGVSDAGLEAFRAAYLPEYIRSSLEEDRGAGISQKFKDTAGQTAYMLGQQAPGMLYSAMAPAAAGGSAGILGSALDAARTGGSVGRAAGNAAVDALKGNIATWFVGAGATGNQLTSLAMEKGYDPINYTNALGNGFAEYITEGLFGITEAQSIANIWQNTGSIKGNILRRLGNWLASGVEEGLEEVVNVPMSGIVDKMTTEKDKKLVGEGGISDIKAMVKNGIQGAIAGLLMGGVGAVTMIKSSVKEGADIRERGNALNNVIEKMPEQIRPAPVNINAATEEDIDAKIAEVLEGLDDSQKTMAAVQNNVGIAQAENGAVETDEQGVDIKQEMAQKTPVQTNAQAGNQAVENGEGFAQEIQESQEVLSNGQGQVLPGDGSQRGFAAADTGSVGTVERAGTADPARGYQSTVAAERTTRANQAGLTPISARELGIASGTELRRNVLMDDESLWDDELKQIKSHWDEMNRTRREKYGTKADMQLNFVLGKIQVEDMNGGTALVDGVVSDSGEVCIQVNGTQRSATELADHEEYHMLSAETPGLSKLIWEAVQNEGLNDAMVERYRRFYTETLGYSDEMVREEILADAYAGLERIQGTDMQSVRELVRKYTVEGREAIEQGWYDPDAEDEYESVDSEGRETRGPPSEARYSVADETDSEGNELSVEQAEQNEPAATADDAAFRERYERRAVNRVVGNYQMILRDIFPAKTAQARKVQKQQLENLARAYEQNGEITQQDIDDAFYELWDSAADIDNELATQYKELKQELRMGVKVSETVKGDIPDYGAYRRAHLGTVGMNNSGLAIDEAYADWSARYPNFFPEDIINPTEQLEQMVKVAEQLKPKIITMDDLYAGDSRAKPEIMVEFVDMVKAMEANAKRQPRTRLPRENDNQWEPSEFDKPETDGDTMMDDATAMEMARETLKQTVKQEEADKKQDPEYWHEVSDGAWNRMNDRAAAIQTEWLRSLTKEGFKGTESLDDLGVKIAGSVADYHLIRQVLENHKAAQAVRRDIRKAERRLKATAKEKQYAAGIASGVFGENDVSEDARLNTVLELADYYMMERTVGMDLIEARRNDMYEEVDNQVETLMQDKDAYKISSSPVMFYRTPQRNMIRMYGKEQGQKVYDFLFAPVAENEAERIRWVNRMYDEVRMVEGEDGKKKPLNRKERALVQMVMEGRAAAEVVAAMEERQTVYNAAENLRNGQDIEDVVREFHLNEDLRDAATGYATWLDTNDILQTTKGVDLKRINNAVELYAKQYDRFYKAINDFLAAHGYEPIGFIKGYAPHIQPESTRNLLQSTLKMMGLSEGVTTLPASIAGQTHTYRPNKRWNPYFMSRHGDQTEYDVAAGYESYVDYLSDILYHTDDTVRIRRAANYFRKTYAPDEISNNLSIAEELRNASPEQKAEMLREADKLGYADVPTAAVINELFDKYVDELYKNIGEQSKYSNFVNWLEDYANQLTGKQSLIDRGMEVLTGRQSLNFANKLNRAFQRANVAGNLSTALNQTAQFPMIISDVGYRNTAMALWDYASGKVRRDGFREKSDFLTAKKGMNDLVIDPADRVINIMFKPSQVADDLMSTIAVRGAYIKGIRQGMSDAEAMKYADRKAEQIMGSRAKGSAPQAFRSKNPVVRMVNMFQIEALNTFEYVEQDLIIQRIKDIKQIDDTKGRVKATAALIVLLGKMLAAAFFWNRITEELYGGSPAQFDLLGYATNFLASGNGLTANQQLLDWIDMAWERAFGETLFDIDQDYNEEFDWENAIDDLGYAVGSDLPLVRNVTGVLGVGDQSLPMPDMSTILDAIATARESGASAETLDAVLTAMGQFIPGGRQINKTYQGARTMVKGGRYYGYGDNERLQYPVDDTTRNWIKALLFGPSGLSENTEFYAAGGDDGLSAGNTRKYQEMMQVGMSPEMAMEVYEEYRRINRLETMTASEKATEFANTLYELGVPEDQAALAREAFRFWTMVPGEASRYDKFIEEGMNPSAAYEVDQVLGELEPEDGESSVSKLQKYKAVIDMTDEETTRMSALAGLMQDKEMARLWAGYDYVDSGTYVAFLEQWQEEYQGENKSQEKVKNVLNGMSLDNDTKAALWQMCGANWKAENNPYSVEVGREVQEAIAEGYAEIEDNERTE